MSADQETQTSESSTSENLFVRALQGKERLALVWWGIGIPLKIIAWVINSSWAVQSIYQGSGEVAIFVFLVTLLAYIAFTVMAWRCAPNTEEKAWKWVARAVLIGSWVLTIYRVAAAG